MKNKIIILFVCLFLPISFFAQRKSHEIGFFGGVSYYMGDINSQKIFYNIEPALGIVYKIDINPRYAVSFNATITSLKGSDADSKNGYQLTRNHSFNTSLKEFATKLEFNFFPYDPNSRFEFLSPYVTAGIGLIIVPAEDNKIPVKPVIPFGVGIKYAFNKRLGIAAEWSYRKTFTDYLDQLPDDEYTSEPVLENKQRSFTGTKDWYSFAGISLTYKFALGSSKCPAYRN